MKSTDFVVARDDPRQCKLIATQLPDGAARPGDALLAPTPDRRLKASEGRGEGPVRQVYLDTLQGRIPPEQGHMLSLP
jgi:hypothetical protein